jgi:origin recognition complex subunit 2
MRSSERVRHAFFGAFLRASLSSKAQTSSMPKVSAETASDAYFAAHSGRATASKTSFAQSLAQEGLPDITSLVPSSDPFTDAILEQHILEFDQWLLELQEGFSLILYGCGSKRDLMARFAERCCQLGDVILVDAHRPEFKPGDIFSALNGSSHTESMIKSSSRGHDSLLWDKLETYRPPHRWLFVLINSIDSPVLSKGQGKITLACLANHPAVRLVGTVDKVHAPMLWSIGDISSRHQFDEQDSSDLDEFNFNFVWHDATTLKPHIEELRGRNLTVPPKFAGGKGKKITSKAGELITETAVIHILASVTERAKKLFRLIGCKQLELVPPGEKFKPRDASLTYSTTFMAARDAFLAQTDSQMKSLLGEFTDHGVIILDADTDAGGEILWISMSPDSLKNVLGSLGQ